MATRLVVTNEADLRADEGTSSNVVQRVITDLSIVHTSVEVGWKMLDNNSGNIQLRTI